MTAKEALLECVQQLSEEQAEGWLGSMRMAPPPIPWRIRPVPPSTQEMLDMSSDELDDVFQIFPPGVDSEELGLWERGTAEVIRTIDD